MRLAPLAAATCLLAGTAYALPNPDRTVKAGANHHIGDASYRGTHGREVTRHDSEEDRMRTHLAFVRDWLAARPTTSPALAARRTQILAYLTEYIDTHHTPENAYLPWRTPVFIDDKGTICAVGYLLERSVGRALPERIAASHRYEYIDDIAREEPDVAKWVADSGFTLEEISHIQPAYSEPDVKTWRTWDLVKHRPADGPYQEGGLAGTFRAGKMEGAWTMTLPDGKKLGEGTFARGAGAWKSYFPTGAVFAEGRYRKNVAEGPWKLYHPSGNLAAEGRFERGTRAGVWHFYYDSPAKTPIAVGAFGKRGAVAGTWHHFDATGALLATSRNVTPHQFRVDDNWDVDGGEGFELDVVGGADLPEHRAHQATVGSLTTELHEYAFAGERVYEYTGFGHTAMYSARGELLVHADGGSWTAAPCHWSAARRSLAATTDLPALHGALWDEARKRVKATGLDLSGGGESDDTGETCGAPVAIAGPRAAALDAIAASRAKVRAITPAFVRDAVLSPSRDSYVSGQLLAYEKQDDTAEPDDDYRKGLEADSQDLARVLQANMVQYVEWPHVDRQFLNLFETLPGRIRWHWYEGDPQT
ncbi:MAG TPA: hypothetical protein VGM88_30120 [Kofleriaceae bacterium]|jgi:hypothetical protein